MSSETDTIVELAARLEAQEHLLRHLIVTVLARSDEPMDAFEGFQKRLTAPLKKRPIQDGDGPQGDESESQVLKIVDGMAKTVREDIQRALGQVSPRRK